MPILKSTKLIDLWNHYNSMIKDREEKYVKEILAADPRSMPEKVYEVWGLQGNIREYAITGVSYNNRNYFGFNKRPTKKDVEKIKAFALIQELSPANIYFGYSINGNGYKTTGSFSLLSLPQKIYSREEAEAQAKPLQEKYATEEQLIASGTHTRCQRCGNVVANSAVVHYNIISFATYGRGGRDMKFCSGTCAGHEQMAHEG